MQKLHSVLETGLGSEHTELHEKGTQATQDFQSSTGAAPQQRIHPVGQREKSTEAPRWVVPEETLERQRRWASNPNTGVPTARATKSSMQSSVPTVGTRAGILPRMSAMPSRDAFPVDPALSSGSTPARGTVWTPSLSENPGRVPTRGKGPIGDRVSNRPVLSTRTAELEIREKVVFRDARESDRSPEGVVVQARAVPGGRRTRKAKRSLQEMKREGEGRRARRFGLEKSGSFFLNQIEKQGR